MCLVATWHTAPTLLLVLGESSRTRQGQNHQGQFLKMKYSIASRWNIKARTSEAGTESCLGREDLKMNIVIKGPALPLSAAMLLAALC